MQTRRGGSSFPSEKRPLAPFRIAAGGRLREPPASRCEMDMKTPPPNFAGLGGGRVEPGEGGEGRVPQVRAGAGRGPPAPGPGCAPGASAVSRPRVSPRLGVGPGDTPTSSPEELVLLLQVVVPAPAAGAAIFGNVCGR